MCRRNQLYAWILLSFGAGVLLGLWLECNFLAHCFGIGVICAGSCLLRKK